MPTSAIRSLKSPLETALHRGADIAIGSRWVDHIGCLRSQPLHCRLCSRAFNRLAACVLSVPFKDTQCSLKALTRGAASRVFPLLRLNGWGYDTELIHAALSIGLRVEEVSLHLVHDYQDSRFRPLSDGWATVRELFEIRWNALQGAYSRSSPVLLPGHCGQARHRCGRRQFIIEPFARSEHVGHRPEPKSPDALTEILRDGP